MQGSRAVGLIVQVPGVLSQENGFYFDGNQSEGQILALTEDFHLKCHTYIG